jgi:hypothetical protein
MSLTGYQMTNTIQKKFKVSSTQLLYQSCPYQALTLFLIGPFLDGFLTNQNVFAFDYTSQVVVSNELHVIWKKYSERRSCSHSVSTESNFALFSCAVFHCVVVLDIRLSEL